MTTVQLPDEDTSNKKKTRLKTKYLGQDCEQMLIFDSEIKTLKCNCNIYVGL